MSTANPFAAAAPTHAAAAPTAPVETAPAAPAAGTENPFAAAAPSAPAAAPQDTATFATPGAPEVPADPFAAPVGGSGEVRIQDLLGHLLIVTPTELQTDVETSNGPADMVIADVVDLSAEGGPERHDGLWVFQRPLVRELKRVLNGNARASMILARLTRGKAAPGRPDHRAPYIFEPATPEEHAAAVEWLNANK